MAQQLLTEWHYPSLSLARWLCYRAAFFFTRHTTTANHHSFRHFDLQNVSTRDGA